MGAAVGGSMRLEHAVRNKIEKARLSISQPSWCLVGEAASADRRIIAGILPEPCSDHEHRAAREDTR
ncbi:MAG: hypothetical protein AABZ30_11300 [Myxococcota bacterium]